MPSHWEPSPGVPRTCGAWAVMNSFPQLCACKFLSKFPSCLRMGQAAEAGAAQRRSDLNGASRRVNGIILLLRRGGRRRPRARPIGAPPVRPAILRAAPVDSGYATPWTPASASWCGTAGMPRTWGCAWLTWQPCCSPSTAWTPPQNRHNSLWRSRRGADRHSVTAAV